MTPDVPKIEVPTLPKDPVEAAGLKQKKARRPIGAASAVSAGTLTSRASTQKSSLLGQIGS